MRTKLILLCAFVLVIGACAAPSTPQPISTNVPTLEATSISEPTQPPVQVEPSPTIESAPAMTMTTYTDEIAGFSLDYPADWFIDTRATADAEHAYAYSVGIATWDLRNPSPPSGKKENAIPEGGTKIDIGVMKQSMTLEEAVAQQSENESGSPILAQKDVTLANGLPGVIIDVDGLAGLTRTLITVLNGNVIYISGYGNLEPFEPIALSLRAN